ncbi:hypothetical protein A28LD_1948 [Idiomarina sp. A28L]|uniref:hypothetical protein n=1 Tax=Idiomarina sp. A28L TaxID=1036674 RepID=UPI00021388DE|nr:hypothetical protein [Idiomarina sp. A28L]EGN74454.1 hypothetical protein A28LD_1948 [Idiomarina sp. A28L]
MNHETLQSYIDTANSGKWSIPISSFKISPTVEVALVWSERPMGKISNEENKRFFLIKNEIEYVAIIYDMKEDNLHWLALERYRKRGYLSRALHDHIFPFLSWEGRSEQKATANTKESEEYLTKLGFEKMLERKPNAMGHQTYSLNLESVGNFKAESIDRTPNSKADIDNIKQELRRLAAEVRIVRDKLECTYDDDFGLDNQANELTRIAHCIDE